MPTYTDHVSQAPGDPSGSIWGLRSLLNCLASSFIVNGWYSTLTGDYLNHVPCPPICNSCKLTLFLFIHRLRQRKWTRQIFVAKGCGLFNADRSDAQIVDYVSVWTFKQIHSEATVKANATPDARLAKQKVDPTFVSLGVVRHDRSKES